MKNNTKNFSKLVEEIGQVSSQCLSPKQSTQPAHAPTQADQARQAQIELEKHIFWQMLIGAKSDEDKQVVKEMLVQKLMGMGKEFKRSLKESEGAKRIKERRALERNAKAAANLNPPVQRIRRRI